MRFATLVSLIGCVLFAVCPTGCGGASEGPRLSAAPTLSITEPASHVTLSRGSILTIRYVDNDPDDRALTTIFADLDGDANTRHDSHEIGSAARDGDGASQQVSWDTTEVPDGRYHILGEIRDDTNPAYVAAAPGHVSVQDVGWVVQAGGPGEDVGYAVATFADGSCVVTGYFEGTATFGSETRTATDGQDVFVVRYDANASVQWVETFGRHDWDQGSDVATFADGSFVVAGTYEASGAADDSFFLKRYRPDGSVAWEDNAQGNFYTDWWDLPDSSAVAVSTFGDGSCVVTGTFTHQVTFGSTTLETMNYGAFIVRYAADGTVSWARQVAGETIGDVPYGTGVSTLADGSCVAVGFFKGTASFGGGVTLTSTHLNKADCFLARYQSDGDLVWAERAGGDKWDRALGVATFPDGSCVVTGHVKSSTFEGVPLVPDGSFVARFGAGGTLEWVKPAGPVTPSTSIGLDAATFADGSCVITGYVAPAGHSSGAFTSRYGADVTLAWTSRSGQLQAADLSDWSNGISTFTDGSCVITGSFLETVSFEGESLTSRGQSDIFVVRYNADGKP